MDDRPSRLDWSRDGPRADGRRAGTNSQANPGAGRPGAGPDRRACGSPRTIEGLEGLSIGRLAEASGVAKSSVHALFGSKEELQLATINAARENFIAEVVGPALAATSAGRDRLLALCEGYLSYVERRVFPGGCFFVAASAEVGAQPGRRTRRSRPRSAAMARPPSSRGPRCRRQGRADRRRRARTARLRTRSDPCRD